MSLESYTQADIELTERRRLEKPLLLLIWLGCVGFSLAEGNLFYLASSTLVLAVNWIAAGRNKVVYINRIFVNIGVITATAIIILEHLRSNHNVLLTLGHYMVLIQLCKLFEKKKNRDYLQLLVMNLLLMLCTALICPSLWFALWTVVYLTLACYVAMVFTLKRGLDSAAEVKLHGELGPLSPRRVAWNVSRYWPGKTVRRVVLVTIIPSLLSGAVVFLLAPRSDGKMLSAIDEQLAASYESNVRLGRSRQLYLSDRVAMRVRISRDGKPGPAQSQSSKYMRRNILDQYSDSTWGNRLRSQRPLLSQASPAGEKLRKKLVRHDVDLLYLGQPDLVVPNTTVKVDVPGCQVSTTCHGEYLLSGSLQPIRSISYTTESFPLPLGKEELSFLRQKRGHHAGPDKPSHSVKLPPIARKKILKLARLWCESILAQRRNQPGNRDELNLAIAWKIAEKLRHNYHYTLDLRDSDPNRDGVEDFLFHLKKGHCEYFASTMAVMCNLLEVPTHVATGFVLGEYSQDKKEYIVRDRDAHAWCEVYSPQRGWAIIDPTSSAARAKTQKRTWWTSMSDFVADIRFMWYGKIVGYDFQTQKELSGRAADKTKKMWHKSREYVVSLGNALRKSFNNLLVHGEVDRILLDFLAAMVALAVLVFLAMLFRLKFRKKQPNQTDMHRKLKLLHRFLVMLHRRGLPSRSGYTLREKLLDAAVKFDLPREPLEEMVALQYRWRWGGEEPTDEDIHLVRQNFVMLCERLSVSTFKRKPGQKTGRKEG